MRDMIVPDGVAKRVYDVVLATDLDKALRAITPIEGLIFIHRPSLRLGGNTKRGRTGRIASRAVVRSSQVTCGTQTNPLRAAAFRP